MSISPHVILGSHFAIAVLRPITHVITAEIHDHTTSAFLSAVEEIVAKASANNYDISSVRLDPKTYARVQRTSKEWCLKNTQLVCDSPTRMTTEPFVGLIRNEIDRRSSSIVPTALPSELKAHLVSAAASEINNCPTQQEYCELTQGSNDVLSFGDLALDNSSHQPNNTLPTARSVFVLYQLHQGEDDYLVYDLQYRVTVVRPRRVMVKAPWGTSDKLAVERMGYEDPKGVDLFWANVRAEATVLVNHKIPGQKKSRITNRMCHSPTTTPQPIDVDTPAVQITNQSGIGVTPDPTMSKQAPSVSFDESRVKPASTTDIVEVEYRSILHSELTGHLPVYAAKPSSVLLVCGNAAAKGKFTANITVRSPSHEADAHPSLSSRPRRLHEGSRNNAWHEITLNELKRLDFVANDKDDYVLNRRIREGTITVVMHGHELLVTCPCEPAILYLKGRLRSRFTDVMYHVGSIIEFGGMLLDFANKPGAVKITMSQIVTSIITDVKPVAAASNDISPAAEDIFESTISTPLSDDLARLYRAAIVKCKYIAGRARPDILLATSVLFARISTCTVRDFAALSHLARYLQCTPDKGIVIEFGERPGFRLSVVANHGVYASEGCGYTGASLVFGEGGPIHNVSMRQSTSSLSRDESEFVSLMDSLPCATRIRKFAIGQGYTQLPIVLCQHTTTITDIIGGRITLRSRHHTYFRHPWIKDQLDKGALVLLHVHPESPWAKLLAYPFEGDVFRSECEYLNNWNYERISNPDCAVHNNKRTRGNEDDTAQQQTPVTWKVINPLPLYGLPTSATNFQIPLVDQIFAATPPSSATGDTGRSSTTL
jgi:hypothetical protein